MTEFAVFVRETDTWAALTRYSDGTTLAIKAFGSLTSLGNFDELSFVNLCEVRKSTEFLYLPRSLL